MTNRLHIPPNGSTTLIKRNGDQLDVAKYMCDLITAMFYDATTRKLAEEVASQPGDLFHELGTLAYFSMKFSPDIKHQMIRTPQRALKDGVANCVDYTVFIGSVAHALGLPVVVRIARFKHDEGFSHVYPIVDGVVMDMCIGQDSGHRSYPHIGMEVTSIETKDFFIN